MDMLRVSELKQREEKRVSGAISTLLYVSVYSKIYKLQVLSKLKEDLATSNEEGCGAVLTNSDKAISLRGAAP